MPVKPTTPTNPADAHFTFAPDGTITKLICRDGREVPFYVKLNQRRIAKPNARFAGGKARVHTWHGTGNTSATAGARAHANWQARSAPYSWHATVDANLISQSLDWDEQGWHAGDGRRGPGNTTSVGIEHCQCDGMDLARVTENGVELARALRNHGFVADTPVDDASAASGLVQHHRWTGKNCPQLLRAGRIAGWTWAKVVGAVKAKVARPVAEPQAEPPAQPPIAPPMGGAPALTREERAVVLASLTSIRDSASAAVKALAG